jgi:cysteine desulfurase
LIFDPATRACSLPSTIYLDYNATTPLAPEVRAAMLPFLDECWGNPSSIHHVGRRARALLDEFRERLAFAMKAKPSEVVFTSGGTEANNLAIFGVARLLKHKGRHLITSAVEHHAVLNCFEQLGRAEGFEVSILPVDKEGRVNPQDLISAIRPDTILVSIMAANNEIGTIQPVAQLGAICRERGVLFHSDAVQWFGKMPFSDIHLFNADLVSLCPHKFHGPKGAGALFIRSPLLPIPILFGGGHENERRAGTENLAAVAGLVAAFDSFVFPPVFSDSVLLPLRRSLEASISSIEGTIVLGDSADRLSNTVAFVTERTDSFALLAALDVEGICASAGAACSAGSLEPSHVVSALGYSRSLAKALVRFSLGRHVLPSEIELVGSLLPSIIERAQGKA